MISFKKHPHKSIIDQDDVANFIQYDTGIHPEVTKLVLDNLFLLIAENTAKKERTRIPLLCVFYAGKTPLSKFKAIFRDGDHIIKTFIKRKVVYAAMWLLPKGLRKTSQVV